MLCYIILYIIILYIIYMLTLRRMNGVTNQKVRNTGHVYIEGCVLYYHLKDNPPLWTQFCKRNTVFKHSIYNTFQ